MTFLNTLAKTLKPSETLAAKARALELKREGKKVIDLSCGEPDIDTPDHIKNAAVEAIKAGKTKYTEVPGIRELREAIVLKLEKDNGIKTQLANVIVTNGGKQALEQLFRVVVSPGDEVVVFAPYWVSYPAFVELCGGVLKVVKGDPTKGYRATASDLEAQMSGKTKLVVINSPSNPTGLTYSAAELTQFGAVLEKFPNAIIVSDEIYEKVVFGDFKYTSFAAACPALVARTVTINGFSKAYSMTGWRVGYAAGPAEIITAMSRLQSQTTSNVCSIAQWACVAALTGSTDFISEMNKNFFKRLNLATEIIRSCSSLQVAGIPEGAFYLFIRFPELAKRTKLTGAELTKKILDLGLVASVPGEAFGDEAAFRISVAASDLEVQSGCEAIVKVVNAIA